MASLLCEMYRLLRRSIVSGGAMYYYYRLASFNNKSSRLASFGDVLKNGAATQIFNHQRPRPVTGPRAHEAIERTVEWITICMGAIAN